MAKRKIGDFVQEQRAAVGGLEEAVAVGLGAGERALAVAEELALHQVFGNRTAVHRDKRLFAARAFMWIVRAASSCRCPTRH